MISNQDPSQYLPPGTDATVLRGYEKQRELSVAQLSRYSSPIGQIHWTTTTTATLYFVKPLSRGVIEINSTDPLASPIVDWRSMTNPADLDLMLTLFRKHRQIFSQPSMQSLGPVELSPFGEQLQSDEELKAALREQINPSNAHQCCTAAMMPQDLGGVVDDELRVYGVQGLRVIDISVWPMITSAAPTATMYGQGEKVSFTGSNSLFVIGMAQC
jgi:choline dehydrogenase